MRSVLTGFGGREVNTAGDSFLVLFDSAERAIRCGLALVEALDAIGISIRVGVHSGEVVQADGQARGVAVHVAARIVAAAAPGEVWLSSVTRDLAEGGRNLDLESRGRHQLKGVDRELACLVVDGAGHDCHGYEPVYDGAGPPIGYVASGGYGHVVEKSIALSYLPVELARPGTALSVALLGERYPARVVEQPLYDPSNERLLS